MSAPRRRTRRGRRGISPRRSSGNGHDRRGPHLRVLHQSGLDLLRTTLKPPQMMSVQSAGDEQVTSPSRWPRSPGAEQPSAVSGAACVRSEVAGGDGPGPGLDLAVLAGVGNSPPALTIRTETPGTGRPTEPGRRRPARTSRTFSHRDGAERSLAVGLEDGTPSGPRTPRRAGGSGAVPARRRGRAEVLVGGRSRGACGAIAGLRRQVVDAVASAAAWAAGRRNLRRQHDRAAHVEGKQQPGPHRPCGSTGWRSGWVPCGRRGSASGGVGPEG